MVVQTGLLSGDGRLVSQRLRGVARREPGGFGAAEFLPIGKNSVAAV
jgi:hypothetical protein